MREAVDIQFCFTPYRSEGFRHSVAAYYLGEYIGQAGFSSSQYINASPRGSLDHVAADIAKADARAYGFVVYDSNALLVLALSRRLRKLRPDRMIIFGGPFCEPRANHDMLLEEGSPVDYVVHSSGYHTLVGLLDSDRIREPEGIRGIAFRDAGGQIQRTPKSDRLALVDLPSPYLSGRVPLDAIYDAEGVFPLIRSQGCTAHCVFCNFAVRSGFRVDTMPIERTLAELELLADYARSRGEIGHIILSDDDFAVDLEGAKQFCARTHEAGLSKHLCFHSHMSINLADPELIKLMAAANFADVNFGVESGVPHVLNKMGKLHRKTRGATDLVAEYEYLDRARELISLCRRLGVRTMASFVTGMPFETYEDAMQTLEYIKTLELSQYSVNLFTPLTGSVFSRQRRGHVAHDTRYATYPRRMSYPFNPTLVPRLAHAFAYPSVKAAVYLTGEFSEGEPQPDGTVHPSMLVSTAGAREFAMGGLAPLLNIGDYLLFELESEDEIEAIDHACVDAELPVPKVDYVFPVLGSGSARELFVHPQYEVTSMLRTGFAELGELELAFDGRPRRMADTALVTTVEEGDDLERFLAELTAIERSDRPIPLAELLLGRHPMRVLHGCRWSAWGCAAESLGLLVVNPDGGVSPCFGGPSVPGPHQGRAALRTRMKATMAAAREALDCETCEAREDCSRCVSLAGVSRERYCHLIRTKGWITHVLPILRLLEESTSIENLRAVSVGVLREQTYELRAQDRGDAPEERRGCYVARDAAGYLIADVRSRVCFRVDSTIALLVEGLRWGSTEAQLVTALRELHGVEADDARARLKYAKTRIWSRSLLRRS